MKAKTVRVWKTVTRQGMVLQSALAYDLPPSWVVDYKRGSWVSARHNNTALYAFKDVADAIKWNFGQEVWMARAEVYQNGMGTHPLKTNLMKWASSLIAFWRNPLTYHNRTGESVSAPTGTILCERIKLEERVK